ncbi:hypothetical protein NGI46_29160, partial [Peribacillus butanolivorans]|nr:hypothetical protein [Peribacillus butanolivorans]
MFESLITLNGPIVEERSNSTLQLSCPVRIIKVSQLFLVEQFLYRYMITVAGVERSCPWGLDPV